MSIQYPTFTFIGSRDQENEQGERPTNLLQDDASILIHFTSADGRLRDMQWAGLHKSFLAVHGPAIGHHDRLAREGKVAVGSVYPAISRKGQKGEKTILIVATRQTAEDPHDLAAIGKALRNIHGWLMAQEDQTKQVALAYPAGPLFVGNDEKGKPVVLRRNKAWNEIGKLFAQYLDTVEQTVRVYIGRDMDQFYADRVVPARPAMSDQFLPDVEVEDSDVIDSMPPVESNDPFLPNYDDLEVVDDRDPEFAESPVIDAQAAAMANHPELAAAFGEYDSLKSAIKHATR